MTPANDVSGPILTPRPWIVGHRGVAAEALENSLESLQLAVTQRADMIEFDVQLTADDRLVAFHDWDLLRLANRPEIVEESPLALLVELMPSLSTLEEILTSLPESMPLNVELKYRIADSEQFTRALVEALGDRQRILLSSFEWDLLAVVRTALPEVAMAPLGEETPEALLDAAERLSAWAVHCHYPLATPELIQTAAAAGWPVLVYTVNEANLARALFEAGVAGVFADAPGQLRRELQRAL